MGSAVPCQPRDKHSTWEDAPALPQHLVENSWELPEERNAHREHREPGGKHQGYHRHHRETQACGLTKLGDLSST